jgi:release factor glutamine methyltransferase
MTVDQLLRWGTLRLGDPREGLPQPRREARWLLARALAVAETWLLAHRGEVVAAPQEATFRDWIERRRVGEPAHYLTGTCPFWGREFLVSPAVLIPRPETELLITAALAVPRPPTPRVLDVGTGTGCLAVTLAAQWPAAYVFAVDLSLAALAVAQANARRHGATVFLAAGDLAEAIVGPFDLVIANLPYVPDADIPRLAPEVSRFEPTLALAGGADGTHLLLRLLGDLPRLLAPSGHALLEIGPGQVSLLEPYWLAGGLQRAAVIADPAGTPRVLHLRPNPGGR